VTLCWPRVILENLVRASFVDTCHNFASIPTLPLAFFATKILRQSYDTTSRLEDGPKTLRHDSTLTVGASVSVILPTYVSSPLLGVIAQPALEDMKTLRNVPLFLHFLLDFLTEPFLFSDGLPAKNAPWARIPTGHHIPSTSSAA